MTPASGRLLDPRAIQFIVAKERAAYFWQADQQRNRELQYARSNPGPGSVIERSVKGASSLGAGLFDLIRAILVRRQAE